MTSLEPIFFGEPSRPLAGCIHRPIGSALQQPPTLGVVICNPFGYEAICAHRSLKGLANAAATHGIPTLRFDYDGTGDSFGDDFDANRLSAWTESVKQAIEILKAKADVSGIVLVGVRLGATLATLAAAGRTDVVGLVAVATIVNGKSYLRELRALQMALDLAPAPSTAPSLPPGMQESVGFAISAETKTQVSAVDLLAQPTAPAPHALLLDRDDLAPNQAWVERLRAQGVVVDHQALPGYVDMVLDPHKAQIPERMWGVAIGWIQERAAAFAQKSAPAGGDASLAETNAVASPPRSASIPFAASTTSMLPTRETLGFIDADDLLFGVMSEPASEEPAASKHGRLGILLLNAGAIHHVGPNRLYVAFARKWAAAGHVVLRLDISGIGDSRTRPGETDNVVYSSRAGEDIAVAVRHLRAQPGVDRVLVMGLCSGAYHGFKAAVAGEDIAVLVPINPLTFFWKEGMSLDYPAHKVASESQRYGQSVMKLESWMKLLRGDVKVRVVAEVMSRRLLSLAERRARDVARRVGHPMADDLGAELEAVVNRGIAIDFVFADGDPGMDLLRLQGGSVVPRLKRVDRLRSHVIDGPDHTFTPVWSHAPLVDQLTAIVKRHVHA